MNSNPIRVLQIIHALGMGGAETWLLEVLRLWRAKGPMAPQMDFLATSGERGVFDDEAMALGARIHYLPYGKKYLMSFGVGLRRILDEGDYDAIHDHQDYASGWHYLLGGRHLPNVRVTHIHNPAYQIRNNYGTSIGRRITAGIGKQLVLRFCTQITGTSWQAIVEHGFDDQKFHRIPRSALHCGFNPSRFAGDPVMAKDSVCAEFGWPSDVRILLFVGRTDKSPDLGHPQNHKNSGFAVNLAIEVAKRDPSLRLVMCGAPSEATPILQSRIDEARCRGRIVMTGIRKDVERFMLASDVLLFPSRGEGLGMVAVEAQAAGLAVLASAAVPRECVVVENMVRFLEVTEDLNPWRDAIVALLAEGKPVLSKCNLAVSKSHFAIDASARNLERIYRAKSLSAKPTDNLEVF
jgi:glycosyltransferase involved in cell wall biosynthesis